MSRFILIFYLSVLGLSAGELSQIALRFFDKMSESSELSEENEGVMISPFCGPQKRELIQARWRARMEWLKEGNFELSPMVEKVDGGMAAVLLGARSKGNPDKATVIAVALVKEREQGQGQWRVAPVEGCFDNTGLGFQPEVRERMRGLERWMISQKVKGVKTLRAAEAEHFRRSMEGLVDPEKLKLEDPEDVLLEFFKAVYAGECDQALIWQGVLEREELPERDWDRDIRATRLGMETTDPRSAWQVLRSNKVMRVISEGQGGREDASYLVSFLSEFRTRPLDEDLHPVRFQMLMTEDGWRVKLPSFLAFDHDQTAHHREAFDRDFQWEDRRGAQEMGAVFEVENTAIRSLEVTGVLEGVLSDLREGDVSSFLRRHYREQEIFDEEQEGDDGLGKLDPDQIDRRRMERYREALTWWGLALGSRERVELNLWKIFQEGDLALGVFELQTKENIFRPDFLAIWLSKDAEGWMILPGRSRPLPHSIHRSLFGAQKKLQNQYETEYEVFRKDLIAEILETFQLDDPSGKAVDEVEGLEILKEWFTLASEGSVRDLLENSGVLNLPEDPEELLQEILFLRSSVKASVGSERLLGSKVEGRFRAFSVMLPVDVRRRPLCALFFLVPSATGHTVLVDIEFPLETNKGLKILNDQRVERLAKDLKKEDLVMIRALREWHQELARPTWEEWKPEQSSTTK